MEERDGSENNLVLLLTSQSDLVNIWLFLYIHLTILEKVCYICRLFLNYLKIASYIFRFKWIASWATDQDATPPDLRKERLECSPHHQACPPPPRGPSRSCWGSSFGCSLSLMLFTYSMACLLTSFVSSSIIVAALPGSLKLALSWRLICIACWSCWSSGWAAPTLS